MKLPILYYGHPLLRKKCEPIEVITEEIRKLAVDMIETADKNNGIGLSASQVGHLVRLFVARKYYEKPDGGLGMTAPKVYINPKLYDHSQEMEEADEGCLSIPGLRVDLFRPISVTLEALDLEGHPFVEKETGYNARVLMHENDHLNGVLHIDRMDARERKKIEPILREIKKKYNP